VDARSAVERVNEEPGDAIGLLLVNIVGSPDDELAPDARGARRLGSNPIGVGRCRASVGRRAV
jgi:hypothetical protein